jgi:hypothetical protein
MAGQKIVKQINVVDGANIVLSAYELADLFYITGTVALTADWSITCPVPVADLSFEFQYRATTTLAGKHIIILGTQLPDIYAAKKVNVVATYNGSWSVTFTPAFDSTNVVETTHIIDESVTLDKLADTTAAFVLVGNAGGRPTFVAVSGDVTIDNAGAISIGNLKITDAMVSNAAAVKIAKLVGVTPSRVLTTAAGTGIVTEHATTITELAYLNTVVAGTAQASKAVVLGAGKTIDEIDIVSVFKIGGVVVAATSADINKLATVTASAAEINVLDSLTAVTADLELLSGAAAATVTNADVLALVNMDSVLSFTADGLELKAGKVLKGDSGVTSAFRIINADATLNTTEDVVIIDVPAGAHLAIALPAANPALKIVIRLFVRTNTGPKNIVFTPNGADTIWAAGVASASHTVVTPAVDTIIQLASFTDGSWIIGK